MQEAKILEELKGIREDVIYIKEHLTDADVLLTDDDIESLRQAEKDLQEGKTKRLM